MIKIMTFSDLHGQYSKNLTRLMGEYSADILLFAGDLQLGTYDDGKEFIDWINSLPYAEKVLIFGNHDGNYENILLYSKTFKNIHFLMNESINVRGLNIFGSPNSLQFGNWWFMNTEEELQKIYAEIPDNTDILLTHSPAFGKRDYTIMGDHAGSISLAERIKQLPNLKWHVCGHIHEGYGINTEDKVSHLNVSLLDERYRLVHIPVILYVED